MSVKKVPLKLLPYEQYSGVNRQDPIRFYYWPILGGMYRRRVEMCLDELSGGEKVLEIGFGTGLSFQNLAEMYSEIWGLDLTADVQAVSEGFKTRGITPFLHNGDILHMPFPDQSFDSVLMISILEHLKPVQQASAFQEVARVLKPGGQAVYGVPIERPLMVLLFWLMGVNIREHHYSTEQDVFSAAQQSLILFRLKTLRLPILGGVYKVGHFIKSEAQPSVSTVVVR